MSIAAERREDTRLRPKEATFVALRPEFDKMGKLLDINRGGLCFQYISKGESVDVPSALNADMFVSNNGYYLPNIPCRMIYDEKIKKGMTFVMDLEYRRCGLRFDRLSPRQMDQLELYLQKHTEEAE